MEIIKILIQALAVIGYIFLAIMGFGAFFFFVLFLLKVFLSYWAKTKISKQEKDARDVEDAQCDTEPDGVLYNDKFYKKIEADPEWTGQKN